MRGYKNFEGSPHPGDLKHLVEIGYTKNTVNANGYPEPEDVVLCRVWASATDAGNQHYRSADVMNTEAVVNFTIRWRNDVKPGMWVRFEDEKWDISTRMKQVQEALANIGIPVMAGIWRATSENQNPPLQYVVYSSTTTEAEHYDDHVRALRTYVYLNLWSDIDPSEMAESIRQAMFGYGFGMLEESDKGYNHPAYDPPTKTYTVQWTWVWYEEVDYGR